MLNFIRTLLSHPNRRAMKRPAAIAVLECLERRELPAALMNPHRVSYQDKDGDMATVYFSLPLLTESNVNSIFKFDVGSVNNSLNSKQQLKQILIRPTLSLMDCRSRLSSKAKRMPLATIRLMLERSSPTELTRSGQH